MTYTKTKIFTMICQGATLTELMNETGRSATFIRSVISQIRQRDIQITFSNNTYKREV